MFETSKIELEITSKCTLFCPDCARTKDKNESIMKWNFGQLSLNSIEKILLAPASGIILSGCYGDPIYHTEFHDVISLIKKYNKTILMNTNGSYRSADWWMKAASLFDERDSIVFSVDGLPGKDLYRVNSDWPSIETGIRIITQHSAADTMWKWIVFKYNEYDVIEGYKLCKSLGIKSFELVKSGRCPPDMIPTRKFEDIELELRNFINETKS